MTVTDVQTDTDKQTMTITAELPVPAERPWQLWSDPRQLERWWGPPTYPATVVDHDLNVGGRVTYFMTGPEGDRFHGWWEVKAVDEPRRLDFVDGFADETGTPNSEMPTTTTRVDFEDREGGSRMTIHSSFDSAEEMERMLEMGMREGMQEALGQIEGVLADDR